MKPCAFRTWEVVASTSVDGSADKIARLAVSIGWRICPLRAEGLPLPEQRKICLKSLGVS